MLENLSRTRLMLSLWSGRYCSRIFALLFLPSLLPDLSGMYGPPSATMPSLADNTRISAQETTPGHSLSTASLMVSMYLKFLIPKLLSASFSDRTLLVESSSREASQDCTQQSWKMFLSQENAVFLWRLYRSLTCSLMMSSA
nr:hypothetical protein Iba_chr04bCG4170 [Ipomoea batatas]